MKNVLIAIILVAAFILAASISGLLQKKTDIKRTTESRTSASQQRSSQQQSSSSQPRSTEAHYEYDYVANMNTKKFHYPWCASVDEMDVKNKRFYYDSTREDLISDGYVPCGRCNP